MTLRCPGAYVVDGGLSHDSHLRSRDSGTPLLSRALTRVGTAQLSHFGKIATLRACDQHFWLSHLFRDSGTGQRDKTL